MIHTRLPAGLGGGGRDPCVFCLTWSALRCRRHIPVEGLLPSLIAAIAGDSASHTSTTSAALPPQLPPILLAGTTTTEALPLLERCCPSCGVGAPPPDGALKVSTEGILK